MNDDAIARLRAPEFTIGRRGYDIREVDAFLLRIADWLESDAAEEIGTYAVQRKLEMIGRTTTHILKTTEAEARKLGEEDRAEAQKVLDAATAKARQTVAKGEQRREAIEVVIADLRARRDELLDELERLGGAASAAVASHRPKAGNGENPGGNREKPGISLESPG
jgi:DivIVA domain-containing protein